VQALYLAQLLPPPSLGELALVVGEHGWLPYALSHLGPEAHAIQERLRDSILRLAAPAQWYPFTDLFVNCLHPGGFERTVTTLRATQLASQGLSREQTSLEIAALIATQNHVQTLRAAAERILEANAAWWEEFALTQSLARDLALTYWRATQPSANLRTVRPDRDLPQLFTPSNQQALIPSATPVQAVLAAYSNAQSGADRWGASDQIPEFTYTPFDQPTETTILRLQPAQQTTQVNSLVIRSLWNQVNALGEMDSDVFLVALGQTMAAPHDADGNVWISAPSIADARGVVPITKFDTPDGSPRRAGHRREDLRRVSECLDRMRNTTITTRQRVVTTYVSGGRKRKKQELQRLESPLIIVAEFLTTQDVAVDQGVIRPLTQDPPFTIAWHYKMGPWLKPFLEGPNRQLVWLVQRVLKYDPVHDYWKKRLARYFIFNLRITAAGGGATLEIPVGALLSELSLPIDQRHPFERTRRPLEHALNQLIEENQINEWSYLKPGGPGDPLPARWVVADPDKDLPSKNWLPVLLNEWKLRITVDALAALPPAVEEQGIEHLQIPTRERMLNMLHHELNDETSPQQDVQGITGQTSSNALKKRASLAAPRGVSERQQQAANESESMSELTDEGVDAAPLRPHGYQVTTRIAKHTRRKPAHTPQTPRNGEGTEAHQDTLWPGADA